jgi:transposase-like protein
MIKKYPKELKSSVVYEICKLKRSTKIVASEYKIPVKTVENWVTAYNKDSTVYEVSELPVSLKIKQLEKENARLKKDNEILKKQYVYSGRTNNPV